MSQEEQISNLIKIGFSNDEAKKIVAASEKGFLQKFLERLPILYLTLLIVLLGFVAFLFVSLNNQSRRLSDLGNRIEKIEIQLTELPLVTDNEETQLPSTASPTRTATIAVITQTPSLTSFPKIYGEIISDGPNIRSGPGTGFESVGKLKKGSLVEVTGKSAEDISIASGVWFYIVSPEYGVSGWLRGDLLEFQGSEFEIRLNLLPVIVPSVTPASIP